MLETRLNLLHKSGQIDTEIYNACKGFIKFMGISYDVQLIEENGASIITHISKAMQRIKTGEKISPMDLSCYEDVVKSKYYPQAKEATCKTETIFNMYFPPNERQFIELYFVIIFDKNSIKTS